MDEFALARALHVLGVVLWIGGVAMVTTVLLPTVARMSPVSEGLAFFDRFRHRFAAQARYTTLLVGLSGFYMVYVLNAYHGFYLVDFYSNVICTGAACATPSARTPHADRSEKEISQNSTYALDFIDNKSDYYCWRGGR
jgi:hypothetical protein